MNIYYNDNGIIFYAVPKRRVESFTHSTNIPLSIYVLVDEASNIALCKDIIDSLDRHESEEPYERIPSPYTVIDGVLLKNGVPVVIQEEPDYKRFRDEYNSAVTYLDARKDTDPQAKILLYVLRVLRKEIV